MSEQADNDNLVSCIACSREYDKDDGFMTDNADYVCSDCYTSCENCDWAGTRDDDWHTVSDSLVQESFFLSTICFRLPRVFRVCACCSSNKGIESPGDIF